MMVIPFQLVVRKLSEERNMAKPIQGSVHQSFGISGADAAGKDPFKIQKAEPTQQPQRSESSKNQSVAEAMLQGNLRAAELNAVFKGEIVGLEPVVQRSDTNYFLPEVNDEVLIKNRE
jgi:hypothetical protein